MMSRLTRNSQEAAFDAEMVLPRSSEENIDRLRRRRSFLRRLKLLKLNLRISLLPLSWHLLSVQSGKLLQPASNLPSTPSASSSTSVPEAPVPWGVPPLSLSSAHLDAQVSALAAPGVGFPPGFGGCREGYGARYNVGPILFCLPLFLRLPPQYPHSEHLRPTPLLGPRHSLLAVFLHWPSCPYCISRSWLALGFHLSQQNSSVRLWWEVH